MKINYEIIGYINKRIRAIENEFNVSIIFWAFRSSYNIGIYRKNSDVDIFFCFDNLSKGPKIIHDMRYHYFDFWGASVNTIKQSIKINDKSYKINKKNYKPVYYNTACKRAGLNYLYSLFFIMDNQYVNGDLKKIKNIFSYEFSKYNPNIIISQIKYGLENMISEIYSKDSMNLNNYLRIVWSILYLKSIKNGNPPGRQYIDDLILDKNIITEDNEYIVQNLFELLNIYRLNSDSKNFNIYDNKQILKARKILEDLCALI